MYFRRNRYTWVIAIFYEAMRKYRPRRVPSGVEPLRIGRPIKVGMRTITIWPDYIDLAPLSSDPAPSPGRIWYNAVEKAIKYSDGEKSNKLTPKIRLPMLVATSLWPIFGHIGVFQQIPFFDWEWRPEEGAKGLPVPFPGIAKDFKGYVPENSLDAEIYAMVRKNEGEEYIQFEVPAGQTGLFSSSDTITFNDGDRIDFAVDTSRCTDGHIYFCWLMVIYESL
jgi:hypothetical protein